MIAEFEIIGRVGNVRNFQDKDGPTAYLINVATTESWQEKVKGRMEWQERTFWHSLTVYKGVEKLGQMLSVGDLVRFTGEIRPWFTTNEETGEVIKQGVSFAVRSRRILKKRQDGGESEAKGPEAPDETDDLPAEDYAA